MVNLLAQAGVVHIDGSGETRYADDSLPVGEAVERAVHLAERHHQLERSRVEVMREYAETSTCRRQFLLGYFGEVLPEPCGNCDTCDGTPEPVGEQAGRTLEHTEFGRGTIVHGTGDRITVLFDSVGYKTLSTTVLKEHGLLEKG